MSYPDSVLFHARLRGLSEDEVATLTETPGLNCRVLDDGTVLVRVDFAHAVPTMPDVEAMEHQLRLALEALVPDGEIIDVRYGLRHAQDAGSPAVEALHRLRREVGRLSISCELERDELVELLTVVAREFTHLDDWLCNGGSMPGDWVRRHPEGDRTAARQIAQRRRPVAMAG